MPRVPWSERSSGDRDQPQRGGRGIHAQRGRRGTGGGGEVARGGRGAGVLGERELADNEVFTEPIKTLIGHLCEKLNIEEVDQ